VSLKHPDKSVGKDREKTLRLLSKRVARHKGGRKEGTWLYLDNPGALGGGGRRVRHFLSARRKTSRRDPRREWERQLGKGLNALEKRTVRALGKKRQVRDSRNRRQREGMPAIVLRALRCRPGENSLQQHFLVRRIGVQGGKEEEDRLKPVARWRKDAGGIRFSKRVSWCYGGERKGGNRYVLHLEESDKAWSITLRREKKDSKSRGKRGDASGEA